MTAERLRTLPRINAVTRTLLAVLLLLSLAPRASANEVCRFRANDAENPFRRWLHSQEVTCVAAGTPLDFPSGLWNVFVRGAKTISTTPLLVDGDAWMPPIDPPLPEGAFVIPRLPEGRAGVIYVPRRGSAFPVDGARVIVPADEPLWLFVVEKSAPVAVIPIAPLAAGSEREVDARGAGTPAIVGWLHVPDADRKELTSVNGVASPILRAGSREGDPLPAPALLHGAFFRIAGAADASTEVRVEGKGWLPDRRMVKGNPGLTVAASPLLVRGTGTLTVHWNTQDDLVALDRSIGSCEDEEEAPRVVITISKCASLRAVGRDSEECTVIREQPVEGFFGSFTFEDIVPGVYRGAMRYGKLPPATGGTTVAPLRIADLRIFASYLTGYGSVTRGGEPLGEKVAIHFPNGIGFAPADSEEYQAVLQPPGVEPEAQIRVEACDGSPRAVVLAEDRPRRMTRFNIDIPANELEVRGATPR